MVLCSVLTIACVSCAHEDIRTNWLGGTWRVDPEATLQWFAKNGLPEHVSDQTITPYALRIAMQEFGDGRFWSRWSFTGDKGATGSFDIHDMTDTDLIIHVRMDDYNQRRLNTGNHG